tara:strand:- start:273 stop:521 length:249 start_codon:yes stop_codon:yes gene_type:complete
MTKYKIVSYIRVEDYEPTYFDSLSEAESELDHLEAMNSCRDNHYVIEETDDADDLIPFNSGLEEVMPTDVAEDYNPNDPANW